ncbi:hypothetical protein C2845_PM09G03910 [Panicum miliaceum]|uniref:DUF4283 domain-containing protein n=1 Tax=Panicum miliaceum TaxID=4540 RepID=A0A3L6S3Q2_PANMI|nr:hypothetical protein C2845_PM09G03910 [Panicum miliaceum]
MAESDFSIRPFHRDSFLVICSSHLARDRALLASPIPLGSTSLSMRPWTRLVNAESSTLLSKVTLELDGVPAHAWDLATASKLVDPHCWIESLDASFANKTDMSTLRISAWTKAPAAIPTAKKLLIAEPSVRVTHPDLRQKKVLEYPVDFHLRSIFNFSASSSSFGGSSPSDDGDSGPDGNPDHSYGFRQGSAGPRIRPSPAATGAAGPAEAPPGPRRRPEVWVADVTGGPPRRRCGPRSQRGILRAPATS